MPTEDLFQRYTTPPPEEQSAIRTGRWSAAHPDCLRKRASGIALDRVVVHTMEGTLRGTERWFKMGTAERGTAYATAAHYLIGREGDVVQMVEDGDKCLHAGNWNSRSIGIEHEARIDDWPVKRNADGSVKSPPFPPRDFPSAMLAASAEVVAVLLKKYGLPADRTHVVGHSDVPGATHRDPGPDWPWDAYMALVQAAYEARA